MRQFLRVTVRRQGQAAAAGQSRARENLKGGRVMGHTNGRGGQYVAESFSAPLRLALDFWQTSGDEMMQTRAVIAATRERWWSCSTLAKAQDRKWSVTVAVERAQRFLV